MLIFLKNSIDKWGKLCYIATVISKVSQLRDAAILKKGGASVLFIDYHSRVPIYEQIKEQVIMLVNTGVYKPGDKLPSIRNLSNELNINVNTIKRAFSELEHDGITYSAQGRGMFVSENPIGNVKIKSHALEDAKSVLSSCKAKGVSKNEVVSLIDEIYSEDNGND